MAAELDAYLKEHGKVKGPLHGLPVSLKDQIPIKGLETTMGIDIQPKAVATWPAEVSTYRLRRLGGEICGRRCRNGQTSPPSGCYSLREDELTPDYHGEF